MKVIWHDLECGGYSADLPLWRSLALERGDPVLDVGAGTGRVTLDLARRGHTITALDRDAELLEELTKRADGLPVDAVLADARDFELGRRFPLCVVPMQTIQLLGGPEGRAHFLGRIRRHLTSGGTVAIAISETLELFDVAAGSTPPIPDVCELEGVVYASHPTAVRENDGGFLLEREREIVTAGGDRSIEHDVIALDRLTCDELKHEAEEARLHSGGTRIVAPTDDHVGSEVVMLTA